MKNPDGTIGKLRMAIGQTWLVVLMNNKPEPLTLKISGIGRRYAVCVDRHRNYLVDFDTGEVKGHRAEVYRNEAEWEEARQAARAWRQFREDIPTKQPAGLTVGAIALARRVLGMAADPKIEVNRAGEKQ